MGHRGHLTSATNVKAKRFILSLVLQLLSYSTIGKSYNGSTPGTPGTRAPNPNEFFTCMTDNYVWKDCSSSTTDSLLMCSRRCLDTDKCIGFNIIPGRLCTVCVAMESRSLEKAASLHTGHVPYGERTASCFTANTMAFPLSPIKPFYTMFIEDGLYDGQVIFFHINLPPSGSTFIIIADGPLDENDPDNNLRISASVSSLGLGLTLSNFDGSAETYGIPNIDVYIPFSEFSYDIIKGELTVVMVVSQQAYTLYAAANYPPLQYPRPSRDRLEDLQYITASKTVAFIRTNTIR